VTPAIARDASDLRRGLLVNLAGYAVKSAYPVLTWVSIYLYGREAFGAFIAAEAILLLSMRACLVGLDKAVLWWVPRQEETGERRGLRSVLVCVAGTSAVAAIAIATQLAPWLAAWRDAPGAELGLRWMAVGLIPMVLTEILVGAALGKRRMEALVVVKEGLVPVCLMVGAVAFYFVGWHTNGLAWAFVLSRVAGLAGAAVFFRRAFRDSQWPASDRRPPAALVRYALPVWFAEMANSILLRLDVMMLTALTDPATVGVYGAILQVGNAIRSVRRAFDPLMTAIISHIGVAHDPQRLVASFSHATALVVAIQLPIFAFLWVFTPWVMERLGEGYAAAGPAVLLLSAFWVVNGALGLHGMIIRGYGRSDLTLANVIATILVEGPLLWLLVPEHGLVGAALAVGLAYSLQSVVQVVQAWYITRTWVYSRTVLGVLALGVLSAAIMGLSWLALAGCDLPVARASAFAAFLLAFGPGFWWMHRSGQLAGGMVHP